ncbi:AMP-binding protein [Salicibibacter cibarius]|uniref:AMP-binding protein n=1 Tax=Salicibibacter cibarius TaxID=2743000 RepID=A0A7T6Z462_9BACI|nr:AMP-binding protein [Salicibibacter cibarius]QQK76407.1 AMP-binding protein [Salicibibacter cibarius]
MNYQALVETFSWEEVEKKFDWQSGDDINMAHLVCDRWAEEPDRIAIYWEDASGNKQTWTYEKLRQKSNQMAHALKHLGVKKGDRVAGLLGKDMELIISVLATWKIGAIYVPLFTAFGPDAIMHRTTDSGVSFLITNREQMSKLEDQNTSFQVLLTDGLTNEGKTFWEFVEAFPNDYVLERTTEMDPSVIQYTSGTTGLPKGAVSTHKSVISLYPYMRYALNIDDEDIFFGGADMGWSYGLMACTFVPLSFGIPILVYKGPFDVEKIYQLLDEYNVTNFTYAPTAYRMMMAAGPELIKNYNIQTKKFSSAGEPLNAEVVRFFENNFGTAIYDHYGSTESGMIVNNYNITDMVVKPGSMGLPLPGYRVRLIDNQGNVVKNGETGEIAIDTTDQDLNFMGYWNNPKKTEGKYLGKWFLTGDLAKQDEEGYFWFDGRSDDVITSAGYRIGPTEVESSLMEHPAVVETAVVGKPDKAKGEIVKAYVVLSDSYQPSEELSKELMTYVKEKLSKHQYPREVEFLENLPKTQSGKIQRYLLRKQE